MYIYIKFNEDFNNNVSKMVEYYYDDYTIIYIVSDGKLV